MRLGNAGLGLWVGGAVAATLALAGCSSGGEDLSPPKISSLRVISETFDPFLSNISAFITSVP